MRRGRRPQVGFPDVPAATLAEAVVKGEPGLGRGPKDTELGYKAFVAYCKQGPGRRVEDLAKEVGCSAAMVSAYRMRNMWVARIEEWWRLRQEMMSAGNGAVAVQGEVEWEKRRTELRVEEWEMHRDLVTAGKEALERWRASDKVPTLTEVAKMLEVASRLARLAAAMPMSYAEVSGNPEKPIRIEIEAALRKVYGDDVDVVDAVVVEG